MTDLPATSTAAILAKIADDNEALGIDPFATDEADCLFYLGTPEPSWLHRVRNCHLFVSHNRLQRLKNLKRATTGWALDSGGFWEVTHRGGWTETPESYIAAVARYDREIGGMEWAAPQDWMVEDEALAATGLTVEEHQRRTVASVVRLRELWPTVSDDTCPIIPVLQGRNAADYLRCIEMYAEAGIDLRDEFLVGIGSVCRLQGTPEIVDVVGAIAEALPGVPLHGFGVKLDGLRQVGHLLASADSQAWSFWGRYEGDKRTDRCEHAARRCSWCAHFAMLWRQDCLDAIGAPGTCAYMPEHVGDLRGYLVAGPAKWVTPVAAAAPVSPLVAVAVEIPAQRSPVQLELFAA